MIRILIASLALALGLSLAVPAGADVLRLPKTGDPAFLIDAPDGWTGAYDDGGNLAFAAADHSTFVQFSVISGDALKAASPPDIAAALAKGSGATAPPITALGTTVDRLPGDGFDAQIPVKAGTAVLHLLLIRLDATHVAVIGILHAAALTPDQQGAVDKLIAATRFVGL